MTPRGKCTWCTTGVPGVPRRVPHALSSESRQHDGHSKADAQGVKHMAICPVLTGEYHVTWLNTEPSGPRHGAHAAFAFAFHFTPLDGRTCRKRRPNLTCTRFAESEQQVYRLIPSISPCRCRQRKEAPAVFRPTTPYAGSGNAN